MLLSILLLSASLLPQEPAGWSARQIPGRPQGGPTPESGGGGGSGNGGYGGCPAPAPVEPPAPSMPTHPGYTGPGDGPARGPDSPGPARPAPYSPGPSAGPTVNAPVTPSPQSLLGTTNYDFDHWSLWWQHNRERFLEPSSLASGPVTPRAESLDSGGVSRTVIFERIVPALEALLEQDPGNGLRSAVLLTLARVGEADGDALGDSPLQVLLAEHLAVGARGPQEVAETACIALGILGRPSSVATLSAVLADSAAGRELTGTHEVPSRMRAFAAYGLGLLGESTVNSDVRRYARHALAAGPAGRSRRARRRSRRRRHRPGTRTGVRRRGRQPRSVFMRFQ